MIVSDSEYLDFSQVPQSKGLNTFTIGLIIVGLIMIFVVGGLVIGFAGFGHMWPSTHSMRMDLGSMPTIQ
ncbi:MAG: hypothetical protein KGN02_12060 [bacterium]|nr:hypothetical protein [bacterium]